MDSVRGVKKTNIRSLVLLSFAFLVTLYKNQCFFTKHKYCIMTWLYQQPLYISLKNKLDVG